MISVVIIGASTGGPPAIATVLSGLSSDFPVPIVVVQHISPDFSAPLAENLEKKIYLKVKEGEQNESLKPGCVYIAPAGRHLKFKHKKIRLDDKPHRNYVKPSIDNAMESAVQVFGDGVVGILLSGVGSDGTSGTGAIKNAGGITIAQDEHTSVAFQMARRAIESGNVDHVLPLEKIAGKLTKLVAGP